MGTKSRPRVGVRAPLRRGVKGKSAGASRKSKKGSSNSDKPPSSRHNLSSPPLKRPKRKSTKEVDVAEVDRAEAVAALVTVVAETKGQNPPGEEAKVVPPPPKSPSPKSDLLTTPVSLVSRPPLLPTRDGLLHCCTVPAQLKGKTSQPLVGLPSGSPHEDREVISAFLQSLEGQQIYCLRPELSTAGHLRHWRKSQTTSGC